MNEEKFFFLHLQIGFFFILSLKWGEESQNPMWASTEIPFLVQFTHKHNHSRVESVFLYCCHPKRRTLFTFCFTSFKKYKRTKVNEERKSERERSGLYPLARRQQRPQQKAQWWTEKKVKKEQNLRDENRFFTHLLNSWIECSFFSFYFVASPACPLACLPFEKRILQQKNGIFLVRRNSEIGNWETQEKM